MKLLPCVCAFLLLALPAGNSTAQNSKENADFKLSINLYNDGLYDLAVEQLKQFVNSFPNTANGVEARFYLGLAQMKLKQFDDARLTFQTFALTYQDNPKAPEAWSNVGECYAALRNYKEAALAFERVKVFHPKSPVAPEALIKASRYFKLAGQPEDARRVLRVALQEYANSNVSLSARTLLGQMYFEEGNLVQAQNELKRVVGEDPSPDAKAQALLVLGNVYQAMGQTTEAQSSYQDIITKYKGSAAVQGAYLNLGKLQTESGKHAEAIENFKKALSGKGDSSFVADAAEGLGDCYGNMGETAKAATEYERSAGYATDNRRAEELQWKVAVVAATGKAWSRSNEACSRLLRASNDLLKRKALLRLALNAAAQDDYGQAIQHLTSFLDQYPTDHAADDVAFRVAALNEQAAKDFRKAASAYDQFITRYPRSKWIDDAYAGAARCYEELKEFDRAAQLYKEVMTRFPSSDLRATAEDRLQSINTFEMKEKDAGVDKLALLLGDIVADKDKIGLSYRLGEIYFHDLKNYAAAAEQFGNAINSGMSDERFVDALYYRARALEYLSWRDGKYRPRAVEAYQTFVSAYPREPRAEDALLSLFLLRSTSLDSARAAYTYVLNMKPDFAKRDILLQRIGMLQEQADSTSAAMSTYGTLLRDFKGSPAIVDAAYRRILLLFRMNLPDSAAREASTYLANFPNASHSAEITRRLADMLVQSGNPNRAVEYYQRLRDKFWYSSFADGAIARLADTYVASGKFSDAIAIYSDLLSEAAANPFAEQGVEASLPLALGKAYRGAGNYPLARKYLSEALALRPSDEIAGSAYNELGLIAKAEGNVDLATSYFRQAGKSSATATRDVADLLFDNGAYADAIRQYTLLAQSATSEQARQYCEARIVLSYYRKNDLATADREQSAFLKKYKNVDEYLASFELERGSYYYRKEDYPTARKAFERVADKFSNTPSAPEAMYWIGKILEVGQKQTEALAQYERLMKKYPSSSIVPRVHLALGNIGYNMEKWDESIRQYRFIVDDPNADPSLLPVAMSNLIETYETAGVFDAALQLTRKYLELYPNSDDSFDKKIKIGILYQRLGYNDQSVVHLQSLLEQAGSDLEGEIRYYIAEANFNKGDYQQAILDFLKVPYLVTKRGKLDWAANSLYMAGQSYEKLGRLDQALTMYQQITERSGIDESFKAAARKEIERVKLVMKKPGSK